MQRITISITDEQAASLKNVQLRTGAPISLQIRRALDLYADVTGKLSHADSVAVSLKTVETWTTKSNDVPPSVKDIAAAIAAFPAEERQKA
jgi:hypothetical protein